MSTLPSKNLGSPTAGKVSSHSLRGRKASDEKIVAVTAYDYTFARLLDEKVDVLLVGDSLGMVIRGEPNTLSVTVDDVIYHCLGVARGARHAHVVADMPFLSYQASETDAVRNAGRMLSEGKAEAVKIEGGVAMASTIARLASVGIPVMGHVGLMPQSVHAYGGFKMQGKTEETRNRILQDALAVEAAGAYSVVLESIPATLAREITAALKIPTIGIGAGVDCDGQILVLQDLLGLNPDFVPRFAKAFAALGEETRRAVDAFASQIRERRFPDAEHSF